MALAVVCCVGLGTLKPVKFVWVLSLLSFAVLGYSFGHFTGGVCYGKCGFSSRFAVVLPA